MKIINLERFIKNKTLREWIEALIFAVVVASVFRTWLYSPFRVPTGSMVPVILEGDQLFADMHAYGFVIPFSEEKFMAEPVKRGDIIIFPDPANPKICQRWYYSLYDTIKSLVFGFFNSGHRPRCIDFIKRAVAVGGDAIHFEGEKTFINGVQETEYTPYFDPAGPRVIRNGTLTVPPDKIFAMGDNRRNSLDSRYWGFVDEKNVRARGRWVYLSIDPGKGIFGGLRFERMFTSLR